jgi:hypothetical protein
MIHIIIKTIHILHENPYYNQMYNFVFNHGDKIWTFLAIKDVQNQNQQHPLKGFNTCAFKNTNTCGLSNEVY